MTRAPGTAPFLRCVLVWVLASGAAAALLRLLLPPVRAAAGWATDPAQAPASFEDALAQAAALLLCGCVVWWWVATSFAVVEAATSLRVGPCPRLLRRAVLLACGLGLVSGLAPASADQSAGQPPVSNNQGSIVGLHLPDRPTADTVLGPEVVEPARRATATAVTVQPGDSLWSIADADLPPNADYMAIDARWREIWAANRRTVGADPDLILPDTVLRLPTRHQHPQEK